MFDQSKADRICELLAEGKSLRKAAEAAHVSPAGVLLWTNDNPEFDKQYAKARITGYQARADALLDTASDETIEPASRRIIVDTMKWELSKMLPKIYGDKLDLNAQVTASVVIRATPQDEAL